MQALWSFTSSERLDQWDGQVKALMPAGAADIPRFVEQPSLEPARANLLYEMLRAVHDIGGENLYGGFVSEFTRTPTERALALIKQAGVPVPDWKVFARSSVLERGGWGRPRPASYFGRAT
jgi:hypothetical protein